VVQGNLQRGAGETGRVGAGMRVHQLRRRPAGGGRTRHRGRRWSPGSRPARRTRHSDDQGRDDDRTDVSPGPHAPYYETASPASSKRTVTEVFSAPESLAVTWWQVDCRAGGWPSGRRRRSSKSTALVPAPPSPFSPVLRRHESGGACSRIVPLVPPRAAKSARFVTNIVTNLGVSRRLLAISD
jgi:hypothetical protein